MYTFKICSSDLGGMLVNLLYYANIYDHLFMVVSQDEDWSIQVILYPTFLGLRIIGAIMEREVLAFFALP